MDLFAAFRWGLFSHAAWKRAHMYLVTALVVVMVAAVPAGILTAHAASLSYSTACPPQFTLTPNHNQPQTLTKVCGSGFDPAGSKVALYFNNIFVQYATPTNGDVIAKITIPIDPGGKYIVKAYQQSSGVTQQATFTITAGFKSLKPTKGGIVAPVDPLCTQLGIEPTPTSLQVQAWGLLANASYGVEWQYKNGPPIEVASGNATASGTLSTSFRIPTEPSGTYDLGIIPGPSPIATFYSSYYSCFTAYGGSGTLDWNWDGVGWDANSIVDLNLLGGVYESATANAVGSIGGSFSKPCPPSGTYQGTITGTVYGGQPASIPITVTVDNTCGCAPRCAPSGSSTIDRGALEARPMIKHS